MSDTCEPTVDEVRSIIATDLTDAQILGLIDDAGLMVQRCVENLSCELKVAIIKWTTAHLISNLSTDTSGGSGVITSESLGDASTSYAKPQLMGEGLKSTTYGQQAIALDPNGCLETLGRRRAFVEVLGRNPNKRRWP